MNFNKSLDATLKEFKINAKNLAEKSGVTPQSISEFRRGKKSIQTDSLEKLLEFLPFEAKVYFFGLLLGEKISTEKLVASMNQEQIAELMIAIAKKMKDSIKPSDDGKNSNQASLKKTILIY